MESLFLDPADNIVFKYGSYLPHWYQNGKITYITFRLADSLPQTKDKELEKIKEAFKKLFPQPWEKNTLLRYRKLLSENVERLLDNGYGSCVLASPVVRNILRDTFHYNDGKTYDLIAYVIMPNHVHCMIVPMEGKNAGDVMANIKRYSAILINRKIGRKGRLWLSESYDRIVRSEDHFKHCINYIRDNPRNLPPDKFSLYLNY